jgi:hypothetical protein
MKTVMNCYLESKSVQSEGMVSIRLGIYSYHDGVSVLASKGTTLGTVSLQFKDDPSTPLPDALRKKLGDMQFGQVYLIEMPA